MLNYFYRVKQHFTFDKDEIKSLLMIVFVFGIVLGYDDGHPEFIMARWLFNLLSSFVIAATVVLAKEVAHKLMAIKRGYTVKMKLWTPILFINLFLVVLLDGQLHIILPVSGLFIYHNERMRIGEFRYGHNYFDNALIAFAGPLANIYLAMFFKFFSGTPNPLITLAIQINLIYALINLIPIDLILFFLQSPRMLQRADVRKHPAPFAGTYILYSTRLFFVFCITVSAVLAAAISTMGIIISTLSALVIGSAVFLVIWFQHGFELV